MVFDNIAPHVVSACIRGEIKSDNKIYDAHQIANLIQSKYFYPLHVYLY